MKRDALVFFALALVAAAAGFGDVAGSMSGTALILALVFVTLAVIALFVIEPLPR